MRCSVGMRRVIERGMMRISFDTVAGVLRDIVLDFVVVFGIVLRGEDRERIDYLCTRRRQRPLPWTIGRHKARIDITSMKVVIDELWGRVVSVVVLGPRNAVTPGFLYVTMHSPILTLAFRILVVHIILTICVINFIQYTHSYPFYIFTYIYSSILSQYQNLNTMGNQNAKNSPVEHHEDEVPNLKNVFVV